MKTIKKNMATVINIKSICSEQDDFISLEKARHYLRGQKGECITRRSLLQRIYRNGFPDGTYSKSSHGNYFFSKNYLMGFKTEDTAA